MEKENTPLINSIITHSQKWAAKRNFSYLKNKIKITNSRLKTEIIIAKQLGYLDSAEHILKAIVENPDWTREDIEAELHLYIQSLSNILEKELNQKQVIDLDYILKEYGYYKGN